MSSQSGWACKMAFRGQMWRDAWKCTTCTTKYHMEYCWLFDAIKEPYGYGGQQSRWYKPLGQRFNSKRPIRTKYKKS